MNPTERASLKSKIADWITSVSPSGLRIPLRFVSIYNQAKKEKIQEEESRIDEDGEVFVVYVDLDYQVSDVRKYMPDIPVFDYLGEKTNTRLAHCYLEVYKDDMYHRFEITPNMDGEILAEKYGAKALNFVDIKDHTIDDFVYLLYKVSPEKSMNCIERKRKGKTKYDVDMIIEFAKTVFQSTENYDLVLNNCQKFAKGLALQLV